MNIKEFNSLNERLIKQLNEEAIDPLTPAKDPNDIKNSLKLKADKKDAEKIEAYQKAKMTNPNSRIGELARLDHDVKVKDAVDAENNKRKFAISQKLGEHKHGILGEGLSDMINDIDSMLEEDSFEKNFYNNNQTTQPDDTNLEEGFIKNKIQNIKDHFARKKAERHNKEHSELIGRIDDLTTQIKLATKDYNEAQALAEKTGREKHEKKATKLLGDLNQLKADLETAQADYARVDKYVADDEFKGIPVKTESLSYDALFEAVDNISKEVKELVSDMKKNQAEQEQAKDDLEIPEIKQTGDPDIDEMVNNIVNEINAEKQKSNPDKQKIKKLLLKIRQLTK